MDITRNVILDLMPLVLADEASDDTRRLVELYLKQDPEFARLVEKSASLDLSAEIPTPLTEEDQMEAYKQAQRLIFWRTVVIAILIAFVILVVLGLAVLAGLFVYSA
jgi:hypothetical protein